jgi:hypothetical protein
MATNMSLRRGNDDTDEQGEGGGVKKKQPRKAVINYSTEQLVIWGKGANQGAGGERERHCYGMS